MARSRNCKPRQLPVASCQFTVPSFQFSERDLRLATGSWPAAGDQQLAAGHRRLATGTRQLETGNRQLETVTGNWRLVTGNWRLSTGDRQLATSVNLVLIGPPGSGKGTQAGRLAKRYRVPHISTGDILRQAVRDGTPLGRQVDSIMARGALVDDALMAGLVRERLASPDAAGGFILDGFPRTVAQAHTLDDIVQDRPLLIALIDVPGDAIVQRLGSRRVCESCGMTQSVSNDNGEAESCPYCGGALIRRADDDPATVRRRLATYASYAGPVIAHYRARPGFIAVDGLRAPGQVTAALTRAIDERRAAIDR